MWKTSLLWQGLAYIFFSQSWSFFIGQHHNRSDDHFWHQLSSRAPASVYTDSPKDWSHRAWNQPVPLSIHPWVKFTEKAILRWYTKHWLTWEHSWCQSRESVPKHTGWLQVRWSHGRHQTSTCLKLHWNLLWCYTNLRHNSIWVLHCVNTVNVHHTFNLMLHCVLTVMLHWYKAALWYYCDCT